MGKTLRTNQCTVIFIVQSISRQVINKFKFFFNSHYLAHTKNIDIFLDFTHVPSFSSCYITEYTEFLKIKLFLIFFVSYFSLIHRSQAPWTSPLFWHQKYIFFWINLPNLQLTITIQSFNCRFVLLLQALTPEPWPRSIPVPLLLLLQ